MLKLKTEIVTQKGVQLDFLIEKKIKQINSKIEFSGLGRKRPVFLVLYLKITNGRQDRNRRKQRFFAGLELLKKARRKDMTNQVKEPTNELAFEFKGITPSGEIVRVHIREQKDKKDKKLFLISTF